ncbi:MAG: glycosyltransferase family 2 protein [Candidatus Saccharibacteria bacterium]|nr:glycosyltransferase family 2 protein [Candidatus Saccharibacteria bacterium]
MMKKISILIPAYNEQEVLEHLYQRIGKLANDNKSYEFEFLFADDGSRDKTLEIIKDYAKKDDRVKYVSLSRNFGKEIGMIAGLDHVTGDATVIIDADLQDPPELIPKMIKFWEEGYDDVYAKRSSREGETWIKIVTANTYYWLLNKMTQGQLIKIPRNTGDFRLLDKRCVEALKQLRESERYTKGMFSWIGYKKKEITYDRDPRAAGEIKQNYRKLINLAIDGITSFSTTPLRISSFIGVIVSAAAFIYLIVVIFKAALFGDTVAGYPSLMAVVLFLGGVQLLSLGVIGEYIGRIFKEVKQRPLYYVEESNVEKPNKKVR